MKPNFLVFDVEATNLHGTGFAVGAVVLDRSTGELIDKFEAKAESQEGFCCQWVKENVLPHLTTMPVIYNIIPLRGAFFDFYKKHKDTAEIWADVAYPVETNFLEAIFNDRPLSREFEMPYPLKDISTLIDVNIDRNEMSGLPFLRKHHPGDDALASAICLVKHFQLQNINN